MTPNEKAEDLINKFIPRVNEFNDFGRLCESTTMENAITQAILCIDEIIKALQDTLLTDNLKVKFQIMWHKEVKQILTNKLK